MTKPFFTPEQVKAIRSTLPPTDRSRPFFDTVSDRDQAYRFCLRYMSVPRTDMQKGICLTRDGVVQAAVLYDWFTGVNCFMHVAAKPGARWMTRSFLHWTFHYPFSQLGVTRVSGWVEASNTEARRLNEHLGFKLEAVLEGAGQNGVDACIYVMHRKDCRYV